MSGNKKLLTIALILLAFLIPSFMVQWLIDDRQNRRNSIIDEVSDKWGQQQTITGPIMTIPLVEYVVVDGKEQEYNRYFHILPNNLKIVSSISPKQRHRGIYEVLLYDATIVITGDFTIASNYALDLANYKLKPELTTMNLGISDMKGIKNTIDFQINQLQQAANPGVISHDIFYSGIYTEMVYFQFGNQYNFRIEIDLRGSESLLFSPVGKETIAAVTSTWTSPSFTGYVLPTDYQINEDGFSADWKVLHLNRSFPQAWLGTKNINDFAFGLNLKIPVDEYQKNMRVAKYAILFIFLTFLTLFLLEVFNKRKVHPIQFIFVGFALLTFYTLLLSISEYTSFGLAYLIAAFSVITLITTYSFAVFKNNMQTAIICAVLCLLYLFLYIVLQLEDFALLVGSIGLFAILSIVMYVTRHIDWEEAMQ